MLTRMDVLENHKAYDSINFELFFCRATECATPDALGT